MNKAKKNKRIINITIFAVVVILAGIFVYSKLAPGKYDGLANCMTEKGVVMYGTEWCPNCQNQKRMFGKSFKNIAYIDCDLNKRACENEEIRGYPTWVFQDGKKLVGVQPIDKLRLTAGC